MHLYGQGLGFRVCPRAYLQSLLLLLKHCSVIVLVKAQFEIVCLACPDRFEHAIHMQ
jgi:hypothetical protein